MTKNKLILLATCALIVIQAAPLTGQKYRADLGLNGGTSWYSTSLMASDIGSDGGSLKFQPNSLLGSQATLWLPGFLVLPRFGLRMNLSFTDTDLQQVVETGTNLRLHDHINLWNTTGDLLFGLKRPKETWSGPELLPYVAVGVGMKWVNPGGSDARVRYTNDGNESSGFPITCMTGTCTATTMNPPGGTGTGIVPGRTSFFLSNEGVPTLLAGLGGDVRLSPTFAIRIEGGDRLWKAPIHRTDPPSANFPSATTPDDSRVGKLVNELYAQAGLHVLVGLSRPAVALAAAPAPSARRVEFVTPPPVVIKANDDMAREYDLRRREDATRMTIVLKERVLFAYDQSDLTYEAKAALDAKVAILNSNPDVRLIVEGYADERGSLSYNQALGLRRANAVRDYMSAVGVTTTRLDVMSYGKERPLSTGTSEADYAQNRRGEFTVLGTLPGFEQR